MNTFCNVSLFPSTGNTKWKALVVDRDELPRLANGPTGWRGLLASASEFHRLASIGMTLLNGALLSHGHVVTRALYNAMPLAHLSHPRILALFARRFGALSQALANDTLDEARSSTRPIRAAFIAYLKSMAVKPRDFPDSAAETAERRRCSTS